MYDTYYNSVKGVFDTNGITSLPVQKFALEQTKIPVLGAFWNLCNTPKFMELVNAHDLKQASRQEESKAQHLNLNDSQQNINKKIIKPQAINQSKVGEGSAPKITVSEGRAQKNYEKFISLKLGSSYKGGLNL